MVNTPRERSLPEVFEVGDHIFENIHTSLLHSMDPQVSQMTIGCGISHNNTVHIIQVQFILLYRFHVIQIKDSHKVRRQILSNI
jgi:hypothetical protein